MEGYYPFTFKNYIDLTESEHLKVLDARNDIEIRKWMFNNNLISLEDHKCFVDGLIGNNNKAYFAAFKGDVFCGAINVIGLDSNPYFGYFSNPLFFEGTNGIEIYYYGLSFIISKFNLEYIHGEILEENKMAFKISKKFGFSFENINNGVRKAFIQTIDWPHGLNEQELLIFVTSNNKKI